jgi:hypothetical protein
MNTALTMQSNEDPYEELSDKFLDLGASPSKTMPNTELWQKAFDEYCKKYIKTTDYEQYVGNLIQELRRFARDSDDDNLALKILSAWYFCMVGDINLIYWDLQITENQPFTPSAMFKNMRKDHFSKIKKWVAAYEILRGLSVSNMDGKEIIKLVYPREEYEIWEEEYFKAASFVMAKDIDIELVHKRIKLGILGAAVKEFGYAGGVVAERLLGMRTEPEIITIKRKGRHSHRSLDEFILKLDLFRVDRSSIAKIAEALEGRISLKHPYLTEKGTFSVRKNKNIPYSTGAKTIARRIKNLGGNYLSFYTREYIFKMRECPKCKYGWGKNNKLYRVIPCERHRGEEGKVIEHEPTTLVTKMLELREEGYFANDLMWCIQEHKSKGIK